jgi:hypothetical protein
VPATRAVVGPALTTVVFRGLGVRVPITDTRFWADSRRGYSGDGGDFIDGEVIDVQDVAGMEPPALPHGPVGGQPLGRPASS